MTLSGSLSDWSVPDLLNMFKVTKKTGTLRLSGLRPGFIHFDEGRVVAAEVATGSDLPPEPDRTRSVDALFMLAADADGRFEMGTYTGPQGSGWDVEDLLSDVSRLESLESDVDEAGLTKAPLMLADQIGGAVTVAPEDWWSLASLVSVLSLDQLEDVFGRARAIRLLHTLWRLGIIETVEDDIVDEGGESSVDADEIQRLHADPDFVDEPVSDQESAEPDEGANEDAEGVESGQDEDSWLDEIAAAAERDIAVAPVSIEARRNLRGISAPASTTLTGPVLDDMRRLRGRAGD